MIALALLLSRPSASSSQTYKSLIGIRDLLSTDPPVSREGNLNVLSGGEGDEEDDATTLLYVPYLQPFSGGDGSPFTLFGTYEGLAASALAMEHLNTGNSSIVPELAGLDGRCPIRFATDSFDTELSQKVGVDWVIRLLADGAGSGLFPAAMLGAASSRISVATSIISGLSGVLQLSGISTSPQLDDKVRRNASCFSSSRDSLGLEGLSGLPDGSETWNCDQPQLTTNLLQCRANSVSLGGRSRTTTVRAFRYWLRWKRGASSTSPSFTW